MMSGLALRMSSTSRWSRWRASGRKLIRKTSASLHRSISTAWPSGWSRARPMLRLPRFGCSISGWKEPAATPPVPSLSPRWASPATACSTLITSAPQSARTAPAEGVKVNWATSTFLTPFMGWCTASDLPVSWSYRSRARWPAGLFRRASGAETSRRLGRLPDRLGVAADAHGLFDGPTHDVGLLLEGQVGHHLGVGQRVGHALGVREVRPEHDVVDRDAQVDQPLRVGLVERVDVDAAVERLHRVLVEEHRAGLPGPLELLVEGPDPGARELDREELEPREAGGQAVADDRGHGVDQVVLLGGQEH